jgi:hypothetical protein
MTLASAVRAIVPLLGGFIALELFGIEHHGRAIAVAVAMALAWLLESLHPAIVGFIGAFLFRATEAAEFETAFGGFATSLPWLLFGVLLMVSAAERGGLSGVLSKLLPGAMTRSMLGASVAVIVAGMGLSWLMPQPVARAMLMVILVSAMAPADGGRRAILGAVAAMASILFDVHAGGAGGMILIAGSAAALAAGAVVLARSLPPLERPDELPASIDGAVGLVVIATIGLWMTTAYHGFPPELVGLAAGLLCAVVAMVRRWKDVTADPLAMILAGTALSIPVVLHETAAIEPLVAGAHQVAALLGLPASLTEYWAWTGLRLLMLDAGVAAGGPSPAAWTLPAGAAATTVFALYQAPSFALAMATCGTRARQVLMLGAVVFVARSMILLFV